MNMSRAELKRLTEILAGKPTWQAAQGRRIYLQQALLDLPIGMQLANSIDVQGDPAATAVSALLALQGAGEVAPGKPALVPFLRQLADDTFNYQEKGFIQEVIARFEPGAGPDPGSTPGGGLPPSGPAPVPADQKQRLAAALLAAFPD